MKKHFYFLFALPFLSVLGYFFILMISHGILGSFLSGESLTEGDFWL